MLGGTGRDCTQPQPSAHLPGTTMLGYCCHHTQKLCGSSALPPMAHAGTCVGPALSLLSLETHLKGPQTPTGGKEEKRIWQAGAKVA